MTMSAPSRANSIATERPIPESPPVIMATFLPVFANLYNKARHTSAQASAVPLYQVLKYAVLEMGELDIRERPFAGSRGFNDVGGIFRLQLALSACCLFRFRFRFRFHLLWHCAILFKRLNEE